MRDVIKQWLTNLESGKYKQCKEQLCDKQGSKLAYCCLGVAYRTLGAKRAKNGCFEFHADEEGFSLGPAAQKALGIPTNEGGFDWDDLQRKRPKLCATLIVDYGVIPRHGAPPTLSCSLVHLNDKGVPFDLIAKVIRARPKGLFA